MAVPWLASPAEVIAQINAWAAEYPEIIQIDTLAQYTGHNVYAVTVTAPGDYSNRHKHISYVPHAHEPGATAGAMDFLNALITGNHLDGSSFNLDRDKVLNEALITIIPDANPDGRSRSPVEYWDGSCSNEELWGIMRGVDPQTGDIWKRVDHWAFKDEPGHPDPVGIVYEQIGPGEYVEPNRSRQSTLFKMLNLLEERCLYDQALPLHQAEMHDWPNDCYVILPCIQDDLPKERSQKNKAFADAILQAWHKEGGNPIPEARPLTYTGEQKQYFIYNWGERYNRMVFATVEVENNSKRTPPAKQLQLISIALSVSIRHLLNNS